MQLGEEAQQPGNRASISMPMDAFPHTYYVVPDARHVRVCSLLVFADGVPAVSWSAGGVASGVAGVYAQSSGSGVERGARGAGERRAVAWRGCWWVLVLAGVALALLAQALLGRSKPLSLGTGSQL